MTTDSSILNLFPSSSDYMSGMSSMLSDYTSLKNGSYGKLLKSYYSMKDESSGTSKSGVSNNILEKLKEEKQNPTVSKETTEANASLEKGISGLKSDVSSLQEDSLYEDTAGGSTASEKVTSALKSFVKDYNASVAASKKSSSGASSNVSSMMQATADEADALSQAGISVNKDGTLSLNEKNIDISKVKELFSSDDKMSYGSKIASRANNAGYYTSSTAGTTAKKANDASTTKETSQSSGSLKSDALELSSKALYEKTTNEAGEEVYDVDKILSTAQSFVKNYNNTIQSAKNMSNSGVTSNLSNLLSKTKSNSEALGGIGISVSQNGSLSLNENTFKKAGMDKVQSAFKDYGSSIAQNAQLVNYYTTTQASPAMDYTKNGAYNTSSIISSFTGAV